MAQTEEEKLQKELEAQLAKDDVTVSDDAVEKMKDNILNGKGSTNYLGIGVHEVQVVSVELMQASTGTLGIRFNVENSDGSSDSTMWLSEAALPYTIENVSRLMVHNAPEDQKAKAKTFMSNIVSAKELYATVVEALKAREKLGNPFMAFLSIREDQSGRTYTDKQGNEKPSLTRNLLSYRPKETPVQSAVKATGGELLSKDTLGDLPF